MIQKNLFSFVLILGFFSCDRKPFINHKIKMEKTGEACGDYENYFRLNSNIAGERYEFKKCLPDGYDDNLVEYKRIGDTLKIRFTQQQKGNTVYAITLDIDSYPAYKILTIDNDSFTIVPSEK